jgi:hypothetical protein
MWSLERVQPVPERSGRESNRSTACFAPRFSEFFARCFVVVVAPCPVILLLYSLVPTLLVWAHNSASGFPVIDAGAIDVVCFTAKEAGNTHWNALLRSSASEGTVCICSDSDALWAIQIPQPGERQSSFIKHRLLSFPSCVRISLGLPQNGQPLIKASSQTRTAEWFAFSALCTVSTASFLCETCGPVYSGSCTTALPISRTPSV